MLRHSEGGHHIIDENERKVRQQLISLIKASGDRLLQLSPCRGLTGRGHWKDGKVFCHYA
jgi:hypothetical protein